MSECITALPMVERVVLVTGDFGVLGGEGDVDLPANKDRLLLLNVIWVSAFSSTFY